MEKTVRVAMSQTMAMFVTTVPAIKLLFFWRKVPDEAHCLTRWGAPEQTRQFEGADCRGMQPTIKY